MNVAARITLRGKGGAWTVVISSDGYTVLQGGTLTTLLHTAADAISTLDRTQSSLPSGVSITLEKLDTSGSNTDTTR